MPINTKTIINILKLNSFSITDFLILIIPKIIAIIPSIKVAKGRKKVRKPKNKNNWRVHNAGMLMEKDEADTH